MADIPQSHLSSVAAIQARLQEVAGLLRQGGAIDPEARRALAELVTELSNALASGSLPPAEVTHLAESTAHLAESLHQQHDSGLVVRARDRLEQAVANAETHAPVVVGLARRLLDALTNIGI